ncbi:Protein of unknown function [Cotesia congregata]|uniref:Uncharacterized protein n=1 Tax=Cotesia congregata TaxID=51543 RepID=A0A8J2MJ45_COTCN|nr:Protein of unknown function [Cotesia congregata]
MNALGLTLGPNAHAYVEKEDAERISIANARAEGCTSEERMSQRSKAAAIFGKKKEGFNSLRMAAI